MSNPTFLDRDHSRTNPTPRRQDDRKESAARGVDAELATEFDAFWQTWPRRVGKVQARRAYAKARRRVDAEIIIAAVNRYAADCASRSCEPKFISHPATWLNGERWEDEYDHQVNGRVVDQDGNPVADPFAAHGYGAKPLGRADALLAAGIAAGARIRAHNEAAAARQEGAQPAAGRAAESPFEPSVAAPFIGPHGVRMTEAAAGKVPP